MTSRRPSSPPGRDPRPRDLRATTPEGPGSVLPPPRGGLDTDAVRRSWPDVLAKVFGIRRVTWTFLSEHAQVLEYDGGRLILGIATEGLARTFHNGPHAEVVRQALIETLGVDAVVEGRIMPARGADLPHRPPTAPGDAHEGAGLAAYDDPPHPDRAARHPEGQAPAPDRPNPPAAAGDADDGADDVAADGADDVAADDADDDADDVAADDADDDEPSRDAIARDASARRGRDGRDGQPPADDGWPRDDGWADERGPDESDEWAPVGGPKGAPLDGFEDLRAAEPGPPTAAAEPAPPTTAPRDSAAPTDPHPPPRPAGGRARMSAYERAKAALGEREQPGPSTGRGGRSRANGPTSGSRPPVDDEVAGVSEDDEDVQGSGALGQPVIAKVLGGVVIDEDAD